MKSTNFEFLRAAQPKLADDAAAIESFIHERPTQAVALLRMFAEHLLHAFVSARGRDGVLAIGEQGPRTIEFDQLLHECENKSSKWVLSAEQLRLFRQIKSEGNKAVHVAEYQAESPLKLLENAHQLATSIARPLAWGAPSGPFREPPRGGEERADLRRQRDEALRKTVDAVKLPDDWKRRDPLLSAPAGTFVGREAFFREINAFIAANTDRVFLIEGQPGRGKTALLSHFIAEHLPTGIVPFYFFFEDGKDSIQTRGWIRHFYAGTLTKVGLPETDRAIEQVDPESLVRRLVARLHDAAKAQPDLRFLFILDAIDEAGTAKAHALALLSESLPSTVQVLVTARPNHVPEKDLARTTVRVLNLESPDQINQHRNDGRLYLQQQVRTRHLNVSASQLDEIGKLGDGNFLVLREICRDLPVDASQIDAHLRNLAELRRTGTPLREELERRAWERLQRLDADELHHIQQTLGLLAISQERLPERVIKHVLNLRKADFQKVLQHASEYIATATIHSATSVDTHDESDSDGLQVFRLYHATFAELVRRELKDELPEMQRRLADSCLKWWSSPKDNFERPYALRHLIQHLLDIPDWPNLEAVLTNLQFIQARFEAGQGHDLLAEYEVILRQHPQQDKDYKRRLEQDAVLHQYVQDIVEYSRRCTAIRNRHERGECDDPLAEMGKLKFPDPPDTTQTIKDMRRAEERQKNPTAHPLKTRPTNFTHIRDFQQFVASRFQLLREVPDATIDIARNYAKTGTVAEAATKLEPTRSDVVRLLQHNLPDAPEPNPFMIRSIDNVKPWECEHLHLWISPDARFGYVMGGLTSSLYDLITCQNLSAPFSHYGDPVAVTLDGQWVLLQAPKDDHAKPLALVNLSTGKVVGECDSIVAYGFHNNCQITPDGSLVVGIDEKMLVIWNTQTGKIRHIRLTDIDLEECHPHHLVLSSSGTMAFVEDSHRDPQNTHQWINNGRRTVINLLNGELIGQFPFGELAKAWEHYPELGDVQPAISYTDPTWTPDRHLIIIHKPDSSNWANSAAIICELGSKIPPRSVPYRITELKCLSADGRYGFALEYGQHHFPLIDLTQGIWQSDAAATTANSEVLHQDNVDFTRTTPETEGFEVLHELDTELYAKIRAANEERERRDKSAALSRVLNSNICDVEYGPSGRETPDTVCVFQDRMWWLPTGKIHVLADGSFFTIANSAEYEKALAEYQKALVEVRKFLDEYRHFLDGHANSIHGYNVAFPTCPAEPINNEIVITDVATGRVSAVGAVRDDYVGATRDGRALIFSSNDNVKFWLLQKSAWAEITCKNMLCHNCRFQQSADGRVGTFGPPHDFIFLNKGCNWEPPCPSVDRTLTRTNHLLFTLDARYILDESEDQTTLWSLSERKCLGIDHAEVCPWDNSPWIDLDGYIRGKANSGRGLQIAVPTSNPPWVTGARLFRIAIVNAQRVPPTGPTPVPFTGESIPGSFDADITYKCHRCGQRSSLPSSVIDTVDAIHRRHGIGPADSPVLMLPDEAWDDEPGLDFECPQCHQPHRSTPFYVDRRPR